MNHGAQKGSRIGLRRKPIAAAILSPLVLAMPVQAMEFDTGSPDLKVRWDNTLKYSAGFRLEDRKAELIADPNQDDGDRNFGKGLISNRVDLLSEFDLSYKQRVGFRVSGAAWYDRVYNQSNDNDSAATLNYTVAANTEFPRAVRNIHGRKAEVLDAFAFMNVDVAQMPLTVRLGKHSVLYGETLFFGANGIAGAQAPTDVIKLLSVPGSQFKEIILPVNQVSSQLQVSNSVSIGAYYQFEYRKSRLPGAGSYFSSADLFDAGGEKFLLGPATFAREPDFKTKDSGQFGVQVRFRLPGQDADYGLYAARYHDKGFQLYLHPLSGGYQLVHPENVKTFGASFSTTVGDANVAGEVSIRRNAPLVSDGQLDFTGTAGVGDSALYAVGSTAHANLSAVYLLPQTALWGGGSFLGEVAWNRRTSVQKNAQALDPNTNRDAWGLRFVFEPTWFQVLPQLDLTMPLGLGYNLRGNSSAVGSFNGGVRKGGDVSIGLKGNYQNQWRFGLNYTHFIGATGAALDSTGHLSFKQSLSDRDYVSLSVQTTF